MSDDDLEAKFELQYDEIRSRKLRSYDGQEETCPKQPPNLLGQLHIKQKNVPDLRPGSSEFMDWFSARLRAGGAWNPDQCRARQKVVIIVPYRDREWQLKVFLHHLHPILQRQQLDYRIVVVEQSQDEDFNRAALMNVGYVEASKYDSYECLVFHDVDLLPEDDRNLYICPGGKQAKHMSVAVNKWNYRLQYKSYFGGVTALSADQFQAINGFSNSFYGWGGEDDDLFHRIKMQNITVYREPANIAKFAMLKHNKVFVQVLL